MKKKFNVQTIRFSVGRSFRQSRHQLSLLFYVTAFGLFSQGFIFAEKTIVPDRLKNEYSHTNNNIQNEEKLDKQYPEKLDKQYPEELAEESPEESVGIKQFIMKETKYIAPEDRQSFSSLAEIFITPGMPPAMMARISNKIKEIPSKSVKFVVDFAQKTITPDTGAFNTGEILNTILYNIKYTPEQNRESLFDLAKQLARPNMLGDTIERIFNIITNLPQEQRSSFPDLVKQLITPDVTEFQIIMIMREIAKIPESEREERVAYAQKNIDLKADDNNFIPRLSNLLQTPLNKSKPHLK
ncbi:MAG: hypothetical protein HEEMFOPI_00008 [Holosporales bacterium]